MRVILAACMITCFIYRSNAQTLQGAFGIDTHLGYTTNTRLTPYVGVWDTTNTGSYTLIAPYIQADLLLKQGIISGAGGFLYQSFLNNNVAWRGMYGTLQYQHYFSYTWRIDMSTGTRLVRSGYRQDLIWFQTFLDWNISPFLKFQFGASRSYRSYLNSPGVPDLHEHFTTYGVGLEYWPSFQWRLSVLVNGDLAHPIEPQKDFDAGLRVTRYFSDRSQLGFYSSWGQFQDSFSGQGSTGGSAPYVPAGHMQNRLLQTGITGELPLTPSIFLTVRLSGLFLGSSYPEKKQMDSQGSLGLRFSFYPGSSDSKNLIEPKWRKDNGTFYFVARYNGRGHLFIVGDFNGWSKPGIPLIRKSGDTYIAPLHLKPGVYEYKILKIDHNQEEWVKLSKSAPKTGDGFGGINGRFIVSGLQQ